MTRDLDFILAKESALPSNEAILATMDSNAANLLGTFPVESDAEEFFDAQWFFSAVLLINFYLCFQICINQLLFFF